MIDRSMRQRLISSELEAELVDEEEQMLQRRMNEPNWTVDRGAGYFAEDRERNKRPCLVQIGRHAGTSRVRMVGINWSKILRHILKRDFFTTAVETRFPILLTAFLSIFCISLFFWTLIYYLVWSVDDSCFSGFNGFVSAFLFAIETQQTIGYGVRAPGDCWVSAILVALHCYITVLLDSIILGIVFTRLSHPKNRGRTIVVSECATIARRDGILKLMCRLMDIKKKQVIDPKIRMHLYLWGGGRTTQEGEHIPVLVQPLVVNNVDTSLLLPITVEHTIDERSPLFGMTHEKLEAASAEIILEFEGSTELGYVFVVRHSYLPSELHWGCTFAPCVRPAGPGEAQHEVDLSRFHEVEPQHDMAMLLPSQQSRKVVAGGRHPVTPPSVLAENTLVLSHECCVGPSPDGGLRLSVRVGDTKPGQMVDVRVRVFLYRWSVMGEGDDQPYTVEELDMSRCPMLLRFPALLHHDIQADSPIAGWASEQGMMADADAELVVVARATMYCNSATVMKSRTYSVLPDVRWGCAFAPAVTLQATRGKGRVGVVDWDAFHAAIPVLANAKAAAPLSTSGSMANPNRMSTPSTAADVNANYVNQARLASAHGIINVHGHLAPALLRRPTEEEAWLPSGSSEVEDESLSTSPNAPNLGLPALAYRSGAVESADKGRGAASWTKKRSLFDALEGLKAEQPNGEMPNGLKSRTNSCLSIDKLN